jgi:peptide/nickel transport system permease protein
MLAAIAIATFGAPVLAPNDPATQFRALVHAPPMPLRFVDADGRWRGPFFYPQRSVDRLASAFVEERATPVALRVWHEGRLLAPVAIAACAGALVLGLLAGLVAGYAGGLVDGVLMRVAELVLILPVLYVVLAARAMLPDTLDAVTVALLVTTVLAALGWPVIARGVRAIVAREAALEYAMAARALGASRTRIVVRHLAPATLGFLRTQALQLLPAAILAETTLSFAGLGFPPGEPSWGTLLIEASDIRVFADTPWLLSAALAVVLVVFSVNLVTFGLSRAASGPAPPPDGAGRLPFC